MALDAEHYFQVSQYYCFIFWELLIRYPHLIMLFVFLDVYFLVSLFIMFSSLCILDTNPLSDA